jgi:hypothetical protein
METWKPVIGYEATYEVSDAGRIRSIQTGHIKKFTHDKRKQRPIVGLWNNNKIRIIYPHKAVLEAFVGTRPQGMEACHNNGDPFDNRLENLRWDTPRANQLDRIKHGTSNRGEKCAASKLTEKQVKDIRVDTRLQRIIAAEYGVRENTISRIKSGKRWSHLL